MYIFLLDQDLQRLGNKADPIPVGRGLNTTVNLEHHYGKYIDGQEIFTAMDSGFTETVESLMNNALAHSGINGKSIGVTAHPKRLLLYPVGGYCRRQLQQCEEEGIIVKL